MTTENIVMSDLQLVLEWFEKAEKNAKRMGKSDGAALWRDGLNEFNKLIREIESLQQELANANAQIDFWTGCAVAKELASTQERLAIVDRGYSSLCKELAAKDAEVAQWRSRVQWSYDEMNKRLQKPYCEFDEY